MYKCSVCGAEFDEPVWEEWREHHGDNYYEPMREAHCPNCTSDMVDEGQTCECCHTNFAEHRWCDNCMESVGNAIESWGKKRGLAWKESKEIFCDWAEEHW